MRTEYKIALYSLKGLSFRIGCNCKKMDYENLNILINYRSLALKYKRYISKLNSNLLKNIKGSFQLSKAQTETHSGDE